MSRKYYTELYEGFMCIAGCPRDGRFVRHETLDKTFAEAATKKIQLGFCRYYEPRSKGQDVQTPGIFPSKDRHLRSRWALKLELPTAEEMDQISTTCFWLEAAVWLRWAQNHMRDIEFDAGWEEIFPFSREMMLQTFQHYILVYLGQGQISDPGPPPEAAYANTTAPNLDMICREWEDAMEDYRDIIMRDEFWLCESRALQSRATMDDHERWKIGVSYQRSLLAP